ncbi:MAG: YkgJ family cysteine cluster protein [Desulfobacterales bacterium]|nr:YkgJ family cysteine cluster protein [Desulfobacterales bacterium]
MRPSHQPNCYQGRILGPSDAFEFDCHSGVACFTRCCRNADMYLYPYDVIRMKRHLGLSSDKFLEQHTVVAVRDNPHFPHVMLKMSAAEDRACTFLTAQGCAIYPHRPYSCRAYPLERAVARRGGGERTAYHGIARHAHCKGHREPRQWTPATWAADQGLAEFEAFNDPWVDIDSIFRANPWGAGGLQSPAMRMAFMACYDMDKFRRFVFDSSFLKRFSVPAERIATIRAADEDLMLFGFDWVRLMLRNQGPLATANGLGAGMREAPST